METRRVVIGCDPGLDGAFAVLVDGALVELADMPTITRAMTKGTRRFLCLDSLDLLMRRLQDDHVGMADDLLFVLEEVSGQTIAGQKKGAVGAFSFGRSFGAVETMAVALRWPQQLVRPPVWKRGMKLKADKNESRLRAMKLYPDFREWFIRVKDDGRAEAALIARWAAALEIDRENNAR